MFTSSNDKGVIYQHTLSDFGIEDFMTEHHQHLVVDLSDVGVTALGDT